MTDRATHLSHHTTDASDESSETSNSAQEVLRKRAEILAQAPQESVQATDLLEVVQFRIGRERYAIETKFVEEIMRRGVITPIPDSAEVLLGVMNLRGEILAVMDLGLLLHSPMEQRNDPWIIVIGEQHTEFGASVDAVTEVISIRVSDLLPLNEHSEDTTSLIRGVTVDALLVLDGSALLKDDRLHIDDV